ncbi:hypothetical protein CAEBREN_16586 [Caenorhabditis brenneri]|uniref:CNH domain-containing protein n=1 Tax=Caenorhabditis brenneri TaxID=135651 RepID=G0P355_CAEBE|nr:hypothetical protein CAEBREN_16586 [Caenorhabditis brenneri]
MWVVYSRVLLSSKLIKTYGQNSLRSSFKEGETIIKKDVEEGKITNKEANTLYRVYNQNLRIKKINVPEPVTFIESVPNGILFASDTFYFIPLDVTSNVSARQLQPPRQADYPVSAQVISSTKILLAFQNHGIFVNFQGDQTRDSLVEWEKMPMEFIYTAPFLYIVHDDSIEILEVSEAREQTMLAEREAFECVNAHIIGRQMQGVLISVSSNDSTVVHRFSTSPAASRGRLPKRRGQSPCATLKRSKN